MLIRLLEVPWAGFATPAPLATFKDDYDEPSTSTTSYTHHHISGGRVAPHATQASTSGGFASVHAAQAQPASAGAGPPGRGPPQAWHVATVSLFASVHAGQAHVSGGAARPRRR